MTISAIPLGVRDTGAVGWIVDLVFILSLSLLPQPRHLAELLLILAATLSTMVVFALERANPDVLLFLMALTTGVLAECRLFLRILGYLFALLAALLKYYPIMILAIVFRETISVFAALSLLILGCLAGFWAEYHADVARGLPSIAQGPFNTDLFAAKNLPSLLGEMIGAAEPSPWAPLMQRIVVGGLYAILLGVSLTICRRLLGIKGLQDALAELTDPERIFLVIGSAVIVGCFFAGQSIGYRGVFLLLVLPGLLAISHRSSADIRSLSLGTSVVIVALMWGECFRLALYRALEGAEITDALAGQLKLVFWLLREVGWWWTVSVMLTVLADFFRDAPVGRWVSSRLDQLVLGVGCSVEPSPLLKSSENQPETSSRHYFGQRSGVSP
jgi:hypothetical protein